jgi:LysM repeat protein
MRITRLLLGVLAPLAIAMPAIGADESSPASSGSVPATAPATQRTVTMGPVVKDAQGREGRVHTVVSGDTLWDISEAYMGSPFVWPKVWKNNPAVKNPHRIYPGNEIWISDNEMRPLAPGESSGFTTSSTGEDAVVKPVGSFPVPSLEDIGLISLEEFETAGAVLGSPEAEKWLAMNRRAFVSFGEDQVREGDRFTIVRENERVRDPETGARLGVHVEKLGWLEITRVGPESSEAFIKASNAEILRGDRLIRRIEPALEVPVRVGDVAGVDGQVALVPDDRSIMGQRDVIFLNRGTDQGVDVGSALELFRPGAVVQDRVTGIDHALPDEVVGNLIVVSARPESAAAIITHSTVDVLLGDRFRGAPDTATSFRTPSTAPLEAAQWTARTIEKGAKEATVAPPAKAAPR